jgi:CBS domain protein
VKGIPLTRIQIQHRPAGTDPVRPVVVDATDQAGPQVWEDMTVEVALSVMAAARTGHLVVRNEDGLCTGLVTRVRLTSVRDGSGYTDRLRLRDIADGSGSSTFTAERTGGSRAIDAPPAARNHPHGR